MNEFIGAAIFTMVNYRYEDRELFISLKPAGNST